MVNQGEQDGRVFPHLETVPDGGSSSTVNHEEEELVEPVELPVDTNATKTKPTNICNKQGEEDGRAFPHFKTVPNEPSHIKV